MANNFRFLNEKCPVCNKTFNNDDDIAVCPECGAPHHRQCFKENKKCGLSESHGDNFRWEATFVTPEETAPKPDEEIKLPFGQTIKVSELPEGISLSDLKLENPLENFPKELEDGVATEDAAVFVRHEIPRYMRKFQRVKNGQVSWNWGAFFFAPYWFFYRKLTKLGVIFLALTIALTSLSLLPSAIKFSTAVYEIEAQTTELTESIEDEADYNAAVVQLAEAMEDVYAENKAGVIILMTQSILNLALSVFIGLNADKWYYRHTLKKMRELSAEQNTEARREKLFTDGGVAYGPVLLAMLLEKALLYGLEMLVLRFM